MPDSPYDYIRRRQASLADSDDTYATPDQTPPSFSAQVAQNDQQAESDEAAAQAQQAKDAAAQAKAQQAQNNIDQANAAAQARVDAANDKANGVITQDQAIPGPTGKAVVTPVPQQNPDGTTAYQPADLGNQTFGDGTILRGRRNQWGAQDWSDSYAPGNAALKLDSAGAIIAKPDGKNSAGLPAKDVTTQGVTGLDATDAQGNPDPSQLKVAPNAPINDPTITGDLDQREQKIVKDAAAQRVKDTVASDASDAQDTLTNARQAHSDARADLTDARAERYTAADGKGEDRYQDALKKVGDTQAALSQATTDAAAKKDAAKKAAADPLAYLEQQQQPPATPAPSLSGPAQTPDTGAVVPNGVNPAPQPGTPQPAGAAPDASTPPSNDQTSLPPPTPPGPTGPAAGPSGPNPAPPAGNGPVTPTDPNSIAGLITGQYGQQPQPTDPDAAPPGMKVIHPMSAGQDFINNFDQKFTNSSIQLVGGLSHLGNAIDHSWLNPGHWINAGVKALGGLDVEAKQDASMKQLDDLLAQGQKNTSKIYPTDESRDNNLSRSASNVTSNVLPMLAAGPAKIGQLTTSVYMAVSGGEATREEVKQRGGSDAAADTAALTTGAVYGLANKIFGPFAKTFEKYLPNASPTMAKAALNFIIGGTVKSTQGAVEMGTMNAANAAATNLALDASGAPVKDDQGKANRRDIVGDTLDGLAQGALFRGLLHPVEFAATEYNNMKVGDALNKQGAQASFVQSTAKAFQGIDIAQAAGHVTPEGAQQAKDELLHFLTPENRAHVQAHVDNVTSAKAQGAQIMLDASQQVKGLGQPNPTLAHLSDSDLQTSVQAGTPDPTIGAELARRQQVASIQSDTQTKLQAVADHLTDSTVATQEISRKPGGAEVLRELNLYNNKVPVGTPKADALTAQKASDLAPKTAGVDLQPNLGHYLAAAHAIEQLPDPDQQTMATAAIKLVNGRALNSSEQTLMLGDGGGTPPAVDALTGRPFVSTSNGKTVLTDAGLERLRTLVPAASDILPKNEQAQLEAQPPPLPGKGGKVADSGTKNSQKSATPPPLPADDNPVQSQPNPEFGHLDDATLTVQRDNLKAAINKAAERGGKVPPAARQRLARIEAEIDHRDRIPMGDDGGGGQPPGFERIPTAPKVGDDVAYTFDHADQGTVKTHGEVTEAGPDHYRVVDANDGVERNVPFSRITSHVPPETPDGKAAESAPEAGKPGAVDGQPQGGDGAANGRPHSPEPSASPESGAKTGEAGKVEDKATADLRLPGIDPKTIAPEHREAARLLSKSYARLKPLFDALGLDPDKIFTPVAHGEGTIGLSVDPSDPTHVQIDLARLDKNLARLGTPGKKALRMDAVLEEEAIHIAGEKVLGDKSDATHEAIWKSLTDDQREKVIAEYGEHLRGDGSTDANRGREYIRMLVQLQRSGRTTEWSNRLSGATVDYLHKVVNYLKSILKPGNQAVQDLVDRIQSVLDRGTQGETAKQSAQPADVSLPNGDTVPAKYELAELGDIQPSHRNGSANPDYPAGLNERDYSLPQEKAKNEGMVSSFDPRRVITDNPDAVNGPPIVDKKGIVLGGNRRTIMLSDPRAYAKYKPYLQQNAERFGLNPDDVAKMHQPVLIRRVDVPEDQRPELIRRLNETPTGGIDSANDAVSAGKQITPDLIKSVSDLFQQDPDKTPLQHLSDGDTKTIAQGLLDAGAIRPNDKEKYIAANGNLTPEGARFARSVLLGGVLPDAQLLREISDTPTETKLLNGLSPLYTMKARGADIAPLQEAVALEADRQRLGIKNVNEHQAQGNLAGIGKESTTEGKTIQSFLAGIKGNEARRAFTQLQNLISPLEPGQTGLFGESNRKSIADVSDAEMNKVITSSKKITKAAADLKQAVAGAEVEANQPNEIHQAAHHVRDLAEKEAPKYLQDVRDAGASVGLTMPPGVEVHAVKTAKSLTTKLGLKADEVPTDLLRTTLISKLPLNAIHNQALALIQRMKSKGYTIYAPDGVADVKTGHVESQGYKDIAIKFERPGDPIIRELQILQPAMKEVKDGRGHVLYDDAKELKTQLKAEKDPAVRARLEGLLAQNKAESDALYDEAYRKDNPDQSASGSGNPSAPRLANIKSPTSLRGAAFLSASNFAKRASTSAGVNGASATSRGLASFRSLGGNAITPTDTPNPGETQHPIAGSAVRDTATPDLFAQPPTPEEARTKADEAPMTKADALRAYNVLSAIRAGGGTLRADQARNLERAERALGQTFIPGTEETAAPPKTAPNPDPVNLQPTRGKRLVHQTLFDTGKDVQAGQNLLFGSAVADEPAIEEPLARYMTALQQGEFSFGKPIDFSREFQTDTGIQPSEPLIARAREMEVQPSEADGAKMSPDQLFHDHLDVADRIAANFDNIPGQQPEDARQVARTALNHAAQTYDPSRGVPFRGYAPRIIRNSLLDSYRSQNRRAAEQTTLDRPIDPSEPEVTAKDQVPANEPTAGEAAARNDAHAQLRDYIQRVSMAPESRRALQGLLDGKDQNEMAKEMGVTPQRVSAMVGVGLEKLRQVFKAKGIDRKAMVAGAEVKDQTETPAFKKWFGDSKMVDDQGKPKVLYHGSKADGVDEFNHDKQVAHRRGVDRGPAGFYFGDKDIAENFAHDHGPGGVAHPERVHAVYLNIKKPFTGRDELTREQVTAFAKAFPEWKSNPLYNYQMRHIASAFREARTNPEEYAKPRQVMLNNAFEHMNVDHPYGDKYPTFEKSVDLRKRYTAFLKSLGYDGFDMSSGTGVVAFDPNQIKSATRNRGTFDPNDARITHGGEIPEAEELPNQKLVKPEDLIIGHDGDSFGEARDNFDAEDPSTWPFAKASELEDYKTELDSFDEDDPDTWDEFLPKALVGEHANIAELADDTEGIADRLESQDGVNPNLAKKARELADEVRGQADQIKDVATRNADYVRNILDQAKSKAEDYFKDSDDPDVNLARTDIDQPEEWPQAWRDEYTNALKQHGVAEDDYEHPARKEINDAFDAKHKPEIEAAQARVAAREKSPEQGTLFGGEVKEEDKMAAGALGFHDFVHGDVAPRIEDVANVFREAHDGMVQTWAPQLRSGSAAKTARVLSANLAEIARARDQAEDAFHKARNLFATRSPAQNLAFIDAIETNSKIADPQLQDIARNLREMNNQRVQLARSLPGKQFRGFIENYFPHIFKQGEFDAAQKYFQRKIEGSRAFLKHRSIPTVREAVQAGFHLVSDNPVDLFLMRWRQMDKFVAAQRVLEELKGDGTARTFKSEAEVPPGWVKIDPKIGWSTEEVAPSKDQPELDGREAKPTLRYVPVYAPGEAAAVLNNYLSPGLRHSPLFGGVYKAVTGAANVLNSAQLGFSFFHLGFTTYDTMVSKAAQAIEQAVEGKGLDALKSIASLPATPVTNFLQGDKLLKEWYRPGSQGDEIGKLVNAVVQGGGRAQMDPLYASHFLQNTITNWKKGNYLGAAMRAPFAITETVMKPIMEYLVPRQKLGVAADLMRREIDKLGPNASQDDVRQAMQRAWSSVDNRLGQLVYDNLHWNKVAKDAALVAVRSVGWNLGTYRELGGGAVDYAKALANLTRGQRAEFTHRMAYATALPLLTMAAGSLIQYLMTGESPSEAMDYFFPKTGETDVNGKPMRIALPSYMKDVFATAHDPVGTIENKVNPLLSSFLQLWNNKDYYGTQVYNPDDPMTQKATDILGFAGKQLLPFSFTGASKFSSANPPPSNSKGLVPRLLGPSTTHALLDVAPSVGAVPAASWISQSSAERRALELEDRLHAGDVKTKADADAAKKYTALRNTITQNDPAQPGLADDERQRRSQLVAKAIRDGIANQTIKPEAVPNLIKKARMTPLQRMFDGIATEYDRRGDPKTAYEQAKTVWDVATPEERKTLGPDFAKLWGKARAIGATKDPNTLTPKQ